MTKAEKSVVIILPKVEPLQCAQLSAAGEKINPEVQQEQIFSRQTTLQCFRESLKKLPWCLQLLEECFLTPSGSIIIAGSRVGLSPEGENHLWNITTEGFICYSSTPGLVLDVKGQPLWEYRAELLQIMLNRARVFVLLTINKKARQVERIKLRADHRQTDARYFKNVHESHILNYVKSKAQKSRVKVKTLINCIVSF